MQRPGRKRRDDGDAIDRDAAEQLLSDVIESTATQVAIVGADLGIVTANAPFRQAFAGGADPAGMPLDLLHGLSSPQARADVLGAVRSTIAHRGDTLFFLDDASPLTRHWWEVSVAPLPSNPGAVLRLRDVTELVEAARVSSAGRGRDAATGLLGHEALEHELASMLGARSGRMPCAAIFQIDQLGLVRAALGDQGAAELVQQVVSTVRHCLPPHGELGRMGEAFAAVFEADSDVHADEVLAACRDAVRQPVSVRGRTMRVTASIGYVTAQSGNPLPPPGAPSALAAMLASAEAALREAVRRGGSRAVRHDALPGDSAEATLQLWNELRAAIQFRQMEVWFQPIVLLDTRRPVGAEALSRWRHPHLGDVAPDEFIPSAERNSEILNIGAFVHDRATLVGRSLRTDTTTRLRDFQISINAAVEELAWPQFATSLLSRIEANEARPEWFTLEVPERAAELGDDISRQNLVLLARSGLTLSLDGCGRSASLLPSLVDLGLQRVKIERSLISQLTADSRVDRVIAALVGLATGLGLDVVATGVETDEQADRLRQFGCRAAQRYLFSPAVPEPDLAPVLRDLAST
ncbi:MAG: EAL domain-containing protein [Ilumatobacteraceae bacterium]